MHMHEWSEGDNPEEAREAMRNMLGPQALDQAIGQAISTCWMMLPEKKKSVAAVEVEIRRVVDRALANLREDASAFGISEEE